MRTQLNRLGAVILSAALLLSLLTACGTGQAEPSDTPAPSAQQTQPQPTTEPEATPSAAQTRTVTDAAGNVVEVPADISKIAVTPLPWSSVIFAIDGTSERMVSINPGAVKAVYSGKFLEQLDPDYGSIDTTSIGSDFSINMEEMMERGVQAVVIWDYQTDEAEQLKELGIAPIMVKNETLEELQASLRAMGQLLGKEERAQAFIDLYSKTYDYIKSFSDQVAAADKPKVLYLRNSELKIQGSDNQMVEALELAGANNVAADVSSITMEEILEIDPDIILLSWFDSFTPADLYNNAIDGQDWSHVSAVVNKQVYKTPIGIYRWDAPGVETPLMMMWLARLIQPEIFAEIDMEKELRDFMSELFQYELTDENVAQILSVEANAGSVQR